MTGKCIEQILYHSVLYSMEHQIKFFTVVLSVVLSTSASIEPELWIHCYRKCTCDMYSNIVNCSHSQLTAPPSEFSNVSSGLLNDIQELHMTGNPLKILKNRQFFGLSNMSSLYLNNCSIHNINKGAFIGLRRLQFLDISRNVITRLGASTMSCLPGLLTLNMGYNQIDYLDPRLLINNTNLLTLSLENNALTSLSNQTFCHQGRLKRLNLKSNSLDFLENGVFHPLQSLVDLSFADNKLEELSSSLLSNRTQLWVLDISGNLFHQINPLLFRSLDNLEFINMSGNPFHCDCINLPLRIWLYNATQWINSTSVSTASCDKPQSFHGIPILDVPTQSFTCDVKQVPNRIMSHTSKAKPFQEPAYRSKLGPLPYDKMMGWNTAATLGALLVLALLCIILDNARMALRSRRKARQKKEEQFLLDVPGGIQSTKYNHTSGSHHSIDNMDSISMVVANQDTTIAMQQDTSLVERPDVETNIGELEKVETSTDKVYCNDTTPTLGVNHTGAKEVNDKSDTQAIQRKRPDSLQITSHSV